jgi:uncharacterized membrane protein
MGYQSAPMAPRNNTMATVSLISAIVGWVLGIITTCGGSLIGIATLGIGSICIAPLGCLTPIGWLVAVITGHMAKNQIKQTGEGGDGQAAAGLIMGYIGLALVVIGLCISLIAVILAMVGVITLPMLEQMQ